MTREAGRGVALGALVALGVALFAAWVLRHLSYPLLWNDEAETAMYGERILDFGYPKVHDGPRWVYELQAPLHVGVKERFDAYIGSTWGQYYVGALGALAARRVDDPYEKTWRLRAPFALAGLAGVLALGALGASLFPERRRRALFALAFLLLAPLSTVLVLHLREMRHYPVVVLLVACILWTYVRSYALGGPRRRDPARGGALACALLAGLMALLSQVFTLPYAALGATLGLDQLGLFLRARGERRAALRRLARGLLPLALSVLLIAPALVFFETFRVAGELARRVRPFHGSFGPAEHLALLLRYLATQELLVPALVARVAALAAARSARDAPPDPGLAARRRVASLLWLLVAVYVGLCALTPFSYERYVVVLSPLLVVAFLLDAATAIELAARRAAPGRRRAVAAAGIAAAAALVLALVPARLPALEGRWRELTVPYRGPVDFVVEAVRARYARPETLVIATNYEPSALAYYLGSRVTLGFACAKQEELAIQPDVIVPRPWRRCRRALDLLAQQAPYETQRLPVANARYNNIPQLTPNPFVPELHRFETPLPAHASDALVLLHRRAESAAR